MLWIKHSPNQLVIITCNVPLNIIYLIEIVGQFEIEEDTELVLEIFISKNGIPLLVSTLEKFEIKSRVSNNHLSCISILKIFEMA